MAEGLAGPADVASAVAAAVAPTDPLFKKRIQFHLERKPYSPISSSESRNFRLETLNPSNSLSLRTPALSAVGPASAVAQSGKKLDGGLDPAFSFSITFRRIGAGLQNLGNTCYLNSVLQCLTYTEPFAAYCQSGEHKSSCRTAGFCAMCALQNHVMNALQSTGKILSPFHIVKNLRCISRNFRNSRQEDAHEYMVNLLESMHKCCLPSGVPTESPSAYEKSLVHKIFGGRLRSQVKCTQCNYCSNKFDPFLDLSLEILRADSLKKALAHFTAIEQLDGGQRQYQCQRCKQKVRAYKQLTVHKAPYVLTIHLKRFGPDMLGQKIDKKVDFEPTLNLKPFVSDQQEADLKYTLYGVLVHAGWSTHSGHYYCFVRTSSGMWHSLDDNQVRPVSEKTVLAQKAYMLFYVRDKSSAMKRPVGVARQDNILANAPGRQVVPQPALNRAIQTAEKKLNISESSSAKSQADDTSHCQPFSVVRKIDPLIQNNGHATSREATSLKANDAVLYDGLQNTTPTKDDMKLENPLTKAAIVTASSPNQKRTKNTSHPSHGCSENNVISYANKNTVPESDKNTCSLLYHKDGPSLTEVEELGSTTSANMLHAANVCVNKQEAVAVTERENSARKFSQTQLKLKKPGKSLPKGQYFGRKQLFLASLSLHKKQQQKRSKKHRLNSKKAIKDETLEDLDTDDQGVSTSEVVKVIDIVSVHSPKKRSHANSGNENNVEGMKDSVDDGNVDRSKDDVMLADADQPRTPHNSSTDQNDGRERNTSSKVAVEKDVMNLLMSFKQTRVPRWDDAELSPSQSNDLEDARDNPIGHVLDEWDEEYDRGKRKKVKKSKSSFGGSYNPFQEIANMKLQQKARMKVNQTSSGNQPFRI